MILRPAHPARGRDEAFVLLIVLVVVLLASMLAVSLMFSIRADVSAQSSIANHEQAWAAAMSGITRAIAVARDPAPGPPTWLDNPAAFQHQAVAPDGDDQWYFTIFSDSDALGSEIRFGLTDENGKLPLLHVPATWIALLPGLDDTLAPALASRSPTDAPAVSDNPPTAETTPPTNQFAAAPENPAFIPSPAADRSPLSLGEIFARAGVPARLLYGEDTNFNLRLDPNEDDADASPPLDDRNGTLDAGLQKLLAVGTYDLNIDGDGKPRINLNDPKADLTGLGLSQVTLDFIAALHRAKRTISHPAQLLGARETLPTPSGPVSPLESGIGPDELPTLLDRCTASHSDRLPGLININTAPVAALAAIPLIGEAGADSIVAARAGLSNEERRTPAWILRRGLISADQFKELAPRLTTRSWQFTFRSIGYALPSGRFLVLAVAIDVATHPARILAVSDLTRFGFPVPADVLQGSNPGN